MTNQGDLPPRAPSPAANLFSLVRQAQAAHVAPGSSQPEEEDIELSRPHQNLSPFITQMSPASSAPSTNASGIPNTEDIEPSTTSRLAPPAPQGHGQGHNLPSSPLNPAYSGATQASNSAGHPRRTLRDRARLVLARRHQEQSQGNLATENGVESNPGAAAMGKVFGSAMVIPGLCFVHDHKGRRAPPILFDLLQLSISDSSQITVDVTSGATSPASLTPAPSGALGGEAGDATGLTGRATDASNSPREDRSHRTYFRIELRYGSLRWVVHRKLYDFIRLHSRLTLAHFQGNLPSLPPFPSQVAYTVERVWRDHDRMRSAALARRLALEEYLLRIIRELHMHVSWEMCEFLEISALSVGPSIGWKGKEGYVERRSESASAGCTTALLTPRWKHTWGICRDSALVFSPSVAESSPTDVLLMDQTLQVLQETRSKVKNPLHRHRITISTRYRKIVLRGASRQDMRGWYEGLKRAVDASPFTRPQRFISYAPIREGAKAQFYVDGESYMHALSTAIDAAKEVIYIEDWWLSPEIYLRRPPRDNAGWRLDRLLQRKAEEGVQIYVFMYKEVAISLPLDSNHSKQTLKGLHRNIHVQRHPDHAPGGTFFWAHHEKFCVIDQRLAFIGGIDLCYGRWDTNAHRLADCEPWHAEAEDAMWPGQDYNNARVKDFANVASYNTTLVNRYLTPRMPWHDTSIHVTGAAARDIGRHFIERWNFVKDLKARDRADLPFLVPQGEYVSSRREEDLEGSCNIQICRSSADWSSGIAHEKSIQTAYCELIAGAEHFIYIENQFFISSTSDPVSTGSQGAVKNRIAEAIVERILRAHREGKPFKAIILMPLMPAFESEVDSPAANTLRLVMHWQYMTISRGGSSIYDRLRAAGIEPTDYVRFYGLRNYDLIRIPVLPENGNTVGDYDEERDGALRTTSVSKSPAEGSSQTDAESQVNGKHREIDEILEGEPSIPTKAEAQKEGRIDETAKEWAHDEAVGGSVAGIPRISMHEGKNLLDHVKHSLQEGKDKIEEVGGAPAATSDPEQKDDDQPFEPPRLSDLGSPEHVPRMGGPKKDDQGDFYAGKEQAKASETSLVNDGLSKAGASTIANGPIVALSADRDMTDEEVRKKEDKVIETGAYVTELVYIHCKLLIVDDRYALCGSANINDRSQCGNRDSEIAAIVEDEEKVECLLGGKKYMASKFARDYRMRLCREHIGLLAHTDMQVMAVVPSQLDAETAKQVCEDQLHGEWHRAAEEAIGDPMSPAFDQYWNGTARTNTEVYRRIFRCVPDDTVTSFEGYRNFTPDPTKIMRGHVADEKLSKAETKEILDTVRGHLVEFPTAFLSEEHLGNTSISAEKILPLDVFI